MDMITEKLDAQELFHLGIKASESGDHDKAIVYLKEAQEKGPDAKIQYILAAEYAEIGMMDRALEGMEKALELDNTLWTAHLQLGLLHILKNNIPAALQCWEQLQQLNEKDPVRLFGKGLIHFSHNQFTEAKQCITEGITLNHSNPSLNNNMAQILVSVEDNIAKNADSLKNNALDKDTSKHLFLAAYDETPKKK